MAQPATQPASKFNIQELLARAHAHWDAGQADHAEQACQIILSQWPGQSDASHLLGVIAHTYGNLDLAVAHLRTACNAPRAPAVYYSNLAEMCRQKGLLTEGIEAGKRAVTLEPSLATAWNNLGILQQEAGLFDESRSSLERVLMLKPDWAEAHNNLGNTCKRLRDSHAARAHYEKAIALRPDYAECYSNLASLLNDDGDCAGALRAGRRAIELNPQLVDAYLNLASVELTQNRPHDALRWLNALAAFAPLHAGALSARARTLKQLEFLDEALATAKQAVTLAPQSAEAHNMLGQIFQAQGQHTQALAAFERAIELPGVAGEDAILSRAAVFMEDGRPEQATAEYARAIQAYPHSLRPIFSRAEIKRFTAADPDITRLETYIAEARDQPLTDRTSAHFALGKAYLEADIPAKAFEHLRIGNRMKRDTFEFDANATTLWLRTIAQVFSKKFLDDSAERTAADGTTAGNPSTLPIFIIGMPRSGTTLVEQILASHPQVQGAGELAALRLVTDSAGPYPAAIPGLTPTDRSTLGAQYLRRVAPLATRQYLIDKMPANFLYAGLVRLILPNARIIHCRRDAADTCLSCYTKLFAAEQLFAYDLKELGTFHRGYEELTAHWQTVLPADRFTEVQYENVVDDMPGEARRLLAWLGLPWDDACLRFHETKRVVRTASLSQVRQPIYSSSKGRWRRYEDYLEPLLAELKARDPRRTRAPSNDA